jgi:predicted amidophosphoribosyltransferase
MRIGRFIIELKMYRLAHELERCACCGQKIPFEENLCHGCGEVVCVPCAKKYGHEGSSAHWVNHSRPFQVRNVI